ncbi:MAG: RNA polymerase sigma-70 factor (ECF subfamily) [Cryomorphaceae bacterium]
MREIARALLVSEIAIHQRLVRTKKKIKNAGIAYKVPDQAELQQSLDSVLTVIYLIFNESYSAYEGLTLTRDELGEEAIRLAQVLHQLLPSPEVAGLLALMLLHQSRNTARSSSEFSFIHLEQQNRRLWDQSKISAG